MASPTRTTYAPKQWHVITPGSIWTQCTHNSGGDVVYTEAAAEPPAYNGELSATNANSSIGDQVYFNNVTAGDSVYLWPLNSEADITVTIAGV